ncbi:MULTISPECIES: Yip1 family protein [Marinobacter]|uniref:Yip1 family protein n=1 Tax=Marinobacter xiaoshiensis TaxID=3073652 RepID=A0ABU2HMN4_9GAMM|nr:MULTISPECIES: Yip1 family protein [unclassified Marinobacter]MBK1872848.1 YIP1 family protein [Marinobacter sp. 1-3A]MBK1886923.1 YIP1 family protein [Marinobacter sp. DY40_1A1]MDS1311821.1 Yip1 family protein [Marinobacter sp. F60267]
MSLSHTFGLLTHPDQQWKAIRKDSESTTQLYLGHVLLLALIPALAGFFGTTQVGWQIGDGQVTRLSVNSALSLSVLFYAAMLAGIFILGKFIDFFAATYDAVDNAPRGVAMAAYTATPMFLIGVIAAYPNIWVNMLAGLIAIAYAVYLLYEGLPILMKIPEERGFMFATAVLTVGLIMFVALLAISVVIWSVGIGPVYVS